MLDISTLLKIGCSREYIRRRVVTTGAGASYNAFLVFKKHVLNFFELIRMLPLL